MNALNRRRYVGKKTLPYDVEIEYLENKAPGGAYIDTGFKPNQNTSIDITVTIVSDGIVSRFFETRNATWNTEYAIVNFGQNDNQLQARFGTGSYGIKLRSKLEPGTYKLSMRDYKVYVDDVFVEDLPSRTFQCNYNLPLFALNNAGTISAGEDCYSRIHACSIYDNGTLIRDFIPVRKGTVGYMYDKVSGELFGNSGTGDFVLGPDKILPYDAEVEYLESTGTQWINTGVIFKKFLYLNFDAQYTDKFSTTQVIAGPSASGGCWIGNASPGKWAISSSTPSSNSSVKSKVEIVYNDSTFLYVDGTAKGNQSRPTNPSNPIAIFNAYGGGFPSSARLYSFRIEDWTDENNKIKLFDAIPVRIGTTGYLYDKVSGTLFDNDGTGDFILGPDKN